ncbi:hypothetical protein BK727_14070 [Bacillus thuringiensis serovar roskildiensis]|uniref:Uncharacterized protein n=1 Tax=Bacillus thuringiensis serovar sooncheon TaxID=180891 RepID=A0A9Q5SHK0_BACTU|nr:hypothetical protein BK707_12535 [Bacillus thuringiensis serovar coreanensis]OTX47996.1 hypothetical protein BK724_10775 [Bacillus thuringiensis serovar sooncheon]OTX54986.1 hypothetical protein BK725_11785 [Bacillus thuringiensis serovar guiyangiensis]OTX69041.1 hypothetical protein BK727_14070 [Bacillus thuringiensis serovar roskildiensis]
MPLQDYAIPSFHAENNHFEYQRVKEQFSYIYLPPISYSNNGIQCIERILLSKNMKEKNFT